MPHQSAAASHRPVVPRIEPLVVNVQNTALLCGLSERKIKTLIAEKTLKSVLAGGRRLVFVDSIHELLGIGGSNKTVQVNTRPKPRS